SDRTNPWVIKQTAYEIRMSGMAEKEADCPNAPPLCVRQRGANHSFGFFRQASGKPCPVGLDGSPDKAAKMARGPTEYSFQPECGAIQRLRFRHLHACLRELRLPLCGNRQHRTVPRVAIGTVALNGGIIELQMVSGASN